MYGQQGFRAFPQPQFFTNVMHAVPGANPDSYADVPTYDAVWLFLDLESSGLDPCAKNFGILEIAAVVTDDDLIVRDSLHVIVHQPEHVLRASSKWCRAHFESRAEGGNDLFHLSRASAISEEAAGIMLRDFISKHAARRLRPAETDHRRRELLRATAFGDPVEQLEEEGVADLDADGAPAPVPPPFHNDAYRVMLAGCSVYFDRHVLLTRYPYLQSCIGHKTIDMTSILEIARRFRPDALYCLRPPSGSHRALVDINETLNVLRWFKNVLLQR